MGAEVHGRFEEERRKGSFQEKRFCTTPMCLPGAFGCMLAFGAYWFVRNPALCIVHSLVEPCVIVVFSSD